MRFEETHANPAITTHDSAKPTTLACHARLRNDTVSALQLSATGRLASRPTPEPG